jgi:hypothetical protein
MSSRSELTRSLGDGSLLLLLLFGVGVDVAEVGFFETTSTAQGNVRGIAIRDVLGRVAKSAKV